MSAALDALGQYRSITSQVQLDVLIYSVTHTLSLSFFLSLSLSLSSRLNIWSSLAASCGRTVSTLSSTAHRNQLMTGVSHVS